MNQTIHTIRVGIFFVLGLALIYAVYSVIGSKSFRKAEGYVVYATFEDLRTLSPGADVRMAGVRIGEVAQTSLADGRGRVALRIDPSYEIPDDSVARIAMASLLGQSYVAVQYGISDRMLGGGRDISTESGPDFNAILGEVQKLGQQLNSIASQFGDFSEMGELFRNLNNLVVDNRERFDSAMADLVSLTTKLNRAEGTLGRLINDDTLYTELMDVVGQLKSAAGDMGETLGGARDLIAKVEAGEGTLGRLLSDDTIARELEVTASNLRAFSEALKSGDGTLAKLVNDDSLYRQLTGLLGKAEQALDGLGDAGPITALGAVSGALF